MQRLPVIISLNQKSPPSSVAGAYECMSPWVRRTVCIVTIGPTPASCQRRNTVFCSCPLPGKTVENQPPLAADLRLLQLFARVACSVSVARPCVQLIGCCAILLASSPRVICCAVVSVVRKSCCFQLSVAYFVRCAVTFDRSLLRIYLVNCVLSHAANMSGLPEGDSQIDPMVVESCGSNDSPCAGAMYSWVGDPTPTTWVESGVAHTQGLVISAPGQARPSPGHPAPQFPRLTPACCATRERGSFLLGLCCEPRPVGMSCSQCCSMLHPPAKAYQAAPFR